MSGPIRLGNWVRNVVKTGGTGNIELDPLEGFASAGVEIGVDKPFHFVFCTPFGAPLEAGKGVMVDATHLQRDRIYAKMVANVYSSAGPDDASLTPSNLPAGCVMHSAPTREMLQDLLLELPLRDYGDVSGAVQINLRTVFSTLNLTGDAALSFSNPPPVGTAHAFTIVATSDVAGDTMFPFGFNLSLPSNVRIGRNAAPPLQLNTAGKNVLNFKTTDGGTTYQLEVENFETMVKELGTIVDETGITLDIRYPESTAFIESTTQDSLTITGVVPGADIAHPAHFSFFNKATSLAKTIIFDPDVFSVVGSNVSQVFVPLGYMADFTIQRNPFDPQGVSLVGPAYKVWVNGINYNTSASGQATTFNASDKGAQVTISQGGRRYALTAAGTGRACRCFGGKSGNSGKWVVAFRLENGTITPSATMSVGLATLGTPLNAPIGFAPGGSYALINAANGLGAGYARIMVSNTVFQSGITPGLEDVVNDVISIHYDSDAGTIKFKVNEVQRGNTITGVPPALVLYPAVSSDFVNGPQLYILNELEFTHRDHIQEKYWPG